VIVLKTVGGGGSAGDAAAISLPRRSVESVGESTTTFDDVEQPSRIKSTLYSTSGGSTLSVEQHQCKLADATMLDMVDLMSTSRGSDEDWATLGGFHASVTAADPWSAIIHRQDTAHVVTSAAVEHGQTDQRQSEADLSETASTSKSTASWLGEAIN